MLLGLFRKKQVVDVADLSQQNLRDIPATLYDSLPKRSLQRLNLAKNQLRDFPKGILRFEGLTELDLSDNDILFLPPTIGLFRQLKVLNLSCNNLPNIPDGIHHCEELISVNLSGNPLGRLCDGVSQLRQLRHLKLNDCELDALPRGIGKLCKLETLELRDNRLVDLPDSFRELQNLEKLDLGTNELESLPPILGLLSSLTELWLDNNILLSLPEEMGMLYNLVFMEASDNRLIDLPSTFGDMCSLKDLYLNDNLLSELPPSFGHLHNLQTCKLSTNRLTTLPDTLTGLQSLIDFDMSHNFLNQLPDSICSVATLVSLNVNENSLEELPDEIGSCVSLTILSLRNNRLTTMPKSMGKLTNLKVLTAIGNRLTRLPYGLLGIETLKAVWLAENQIRPMLEFQTQEDSETGDKWITCVVLPQKEPKNLFEESQTSSGSDLTMVEVNESISPQAVIVNFDSAAKESKSSISRDLTPYPKALKERITKWRRSKDLVADNANGEEEEEEDSYNENKDVPSPVRLRVHASPRKLSRPYSLMQAMNNPIQDFNGYTRNPSVHLGGVCSSVDLQTSAEISEETSDEESNTTMDTTQPQQDENIDPAEGVKTASNNKADLTVIPSTEFDQLDNISSNSNSNNSNAAQDPFIGGGYDQDEPHYQTPSSVISDSNSVISTKLSKYMRLDPDTNEAVVQDVPAWYMSPTPSPYRQLPLGRDSVNINNTDSELSTSDVFSPSTTHPMASPPAFVSPICDSHTPSDIYHAPVTMDTVFTSPHSPSFNNHLPHQVVNTDNHYQSPLAISHSVETTHYDFVKPVKSQYRHIPMSTSHRGSSPGPKRFRERDFAIEYTLQTQMKPQLIHTRDCKSTSDADQLNRAGDENHIYSHPRILSYSGRNTPETPRAGYKSMSSLCDSGIESMRRPTPLGTSLSRSASAGVGLDSFGSLSRTYEVTLRKNPTLGMAITGGKDGENAINPNDKGFHVFRLVDGMPASTCGKIEVGDKILEVNGVNVNDLTNSQIVKLLTGSEPYTTLLLTRQPSMTLL